MSNQLPAERFPRRLEVVRKVPFTWVVGNLEVLAAPLLERHGETHDANTKLLQWLREHVAHAPAGQNSGEILVFETSGDISNTDLRREIGMLRGEHELAGQRLVEGKPEHLLLAVSDYMFGENADLLKQGTLWRGWIVATGAKPKLVPPNTPEAYTRTGTRTRVPAINSLDMAAAELAPGDSSVELKLLEGSAESNPDYVYPAGTKFVLIAPDEHAPAAYETL